MGDSGLEGVLPDSGETQSQHQNRACKAQPGPRPSEACQQKHNGLVGQKYDPIPDGKSDLISHISLLPHIRLSTSCIFLS